MRKPNKNKMAGVNSRFASVSESIFNGFLLKMLLLNIHLHLFSSYFVAHRALLLYLSLDIICSVKAQMTVFLELRSRNR